MLTNLLPGLREIRAPLISGYLWLAFFFLAFHGDLPDRQDAHPALKPLFDLGHDLSALGIATVSGVAAYLVGSAVQELLKLLASVSPGQPLYAEPGTHLSNTGRLDVAQAVRIRVQGIQRKLFQVALSPGERGVDVEPTSATVKKELPLIRTLLLGDHPDLVGELDRLQAEADLRITVAVPIIAFAAFFAIEISVAWLLALLPAGLLFAQGYQRQVEVGDLLAKALRIGKVDAPCLESLAASATAAIERTELEEELAKTAKNESSPMAAFRLGNLQASGEDYEAAIRSLRFAAEHEVIRAYAEVGLVYEALDQVKEAEQAYRDGEKRRDKRATERLAALLRRLQREEEALQAERRVEEASEPEVNRRADREPKRKPEIEAPEQANRIIDYEQRMVNGDAKAALNLGLLRQRRGEWAKAIKAFETATKMNDQDAQAWLWLGRGLIQVTEYVAAGRAFERARAQLELDLGSDHLEVAEARSDLAAVMSELGDPRTGQRMLERALEIQEDGLGEDSLEVSRSLDALAVSLSIQGESERAWEIERRSLRIKESELGAEDRSVAVSLHNLAMISLNMGDSFGAMGLLDRAQRIVKLDSDSNSDWGPLSTVLDGLGFFWGTMGEYRQSLEFHERALLLKERGLSPQYPAWVLSRVLCARALHGLGRGRRAIKLMGGALPALERACGPESPIVLRTLLILSGIVLDQVRVEDAVALAERATALAESYPGLRQLEAMVLLGNGRIVQGRLDAAAEQFEKAMRIAEERFGASHHYSAPLHLGLGVIAGKEGRVSTAIAQIGEAVDVLEGAPIPQRPALGVARRRLAEATLEAAEFDAAEQNARDSIATLEAAFGKVHPEIAEALDVLASTLEAKGDPTQAEVARSRAGAIREEPEDTRGAGGDPVDAEGQ
ncbi:MAG: tetratricopeptide repeat protein [Solirubrobacterales bacterium]